MAEAAKEKQAPPDIAFKINRVSTREFRYRDFARIPDEARAKFSFDSEVAMDEARERIRVENTVTVTLDWEEQDNPEIAYLCIEYQFLLREGPEIVRQEGRNLKVPHRLVFTVVSIAVSTTRGILLEKGRGTSLENYILPPVNVHELVSDPDEEGYVILAAGRE